jgi:myo-inositol-1(or 4)-monophosphatase
VIDNPLRAVADAAAFAGAEVVVERYGNLIELRGKGLPGDWVSAADFAAEEAVRAVLAEATPEIPVLGEEFGGELADTVWIVDPLDGTTNFVHGFPAVGVSVGLVEHGRPTVGAVHAPLLGEIYLASEGDGATRNGVPITVSNRPLHQSVIATGFPFRSKGEFLDRYLAAFGRVLGEVEDLRRVGAASLDLVWSAAGIFDGFFELTLAPWDMAAGAVIVREAGGVVSDWSGDPDGWLTSGNIVAAGPEVHAALLDLIR